MIIYHKTDGRLISTEVTLGGNGAGVKHGSWVSDKHLPFVQKLLDNGDVFVTGATHVGASYTGYYASRDDYSHYNLEDGVSQGTPFQEERSDALIARDKKSMSLLNMAKKEFDKNAKEYFFSKSNYMCNPDFHYVGIWNEDNSYAEYFLDIEEGINLSFGRDGINSASEAEFLYNTGDITSDAGVRIRMLDEYRNPSMKKPISINGFDAVLDKDGYEAALASPNYAKASEDGDYALNHYIDNARSMNTTYVPCILSDDEAKRINGFDYVSVSEYAVTVYWKDGGTSTPAYRVKFEGAELSEMDRTLDGASKPIEGLVNYALEEAGDALRLESEFKQQRSREDRNGLSPEDDPMKDFNPNTYEKPELEEPDDEPSSSMKI